jgi:hypothetical protein
VHKPLSTPRVWHCKVINSGRLQTYAQISDKLKKLAKGKYTSLFCCSISDEEKMFNGIATLSTAGTFCMVNRLGSSCLKVGCDADDRMSNFAQDCDVTVTPEVLEDSDAMHSASSVIKIFVTFKVVLSRLFPQVDYHLFK